MRKVERSKRIMSLILAGIMVLGSILSCAEPAFAFAGRKGDEYTVYDGGQIWYGTGDGGYSNSKLTDLGDDLGTRYSYCVQPDKPSPPSGTVTVDIVIEDDADTGKWNALRNICYYSPSYPGYDNNVKNIIADYYTGDFSLDWGIAHMAMSYIYKGRPDDMETYGGTWASGLGDVWIKAKRLGDALWKDGSSKDDAVPDSFKVFICKMSGVQDMVVGYMEGPGRLKMKKSGELAVITEGNKMYSLEGAEYQVFDGSGEVKATLVIDANGDSNEVELPAGTYTVKESKAPTGYAIDASEYTVKIESDELATFTATEIPIMGKVSILFTKIPEGFSKPSGEGDATLAGAVYKFSYYDGIFETPEAALNSGKAKASWHFVTDGEGRIYGENPTLSKDYENSSFYRDSEGNIVYPLGSYVIEEVKESKGYMLNPEKFIGTITEDGTKSIYVETYNDPKGTETSVRGGVKVGKIDRERNKAVPQGDATLEGAEFTVTNASLSSVRVGDKEYGKDEDVLVMTTGKDGIATSTNDALPYGTYTVRETKAPTGYLLNEKWNEKFEVRENGVIVDLTKKPVDEPVQRGGVKISKIDADLDKAYAQGDATLEGAEFTIYNNSKESVFVNGKEYAKNAAVLTIKTDKDGNSSTKKDALPYGTYLIKETKPSKGYLLNQEWNKPFEIREPGVIVDLTEGPTEESVIRGGVRISKIDLQLDEAYAQGDATLEGAEFTIYNKSKQNVFVDGKEYKPGEAVKVITTNKDGIAEAPKNALPYGSYLIKETKPSKGYLLNETWEKPFEIREDGKIIDLTEEKVTEEVIRGGVQIIKRDKELAKAEALGGATLEGIEMTIKNVSGHDVVVRSDIGSQDKVDWKKGSFKELFETEAIKRVKPGEDVGKIIVHWNEEKKAYTAETLSDDLPYGTYTIRESKTRILPKN